MTVTGARITCGNSGDYDPVLAPGCMPVCEACLQKWLDSRPVVAPRRAVHFVGFRGDEYVSACRVWGRPDFIHIGWDFRAQREIAPGDVVVFARGPADQQPQQRSFPDIVEP